MQLTRPVIAADPRLFGRRHDGGGAAQLPREETVGADLRLFATTFTAGFLFVFLLIA